MRLPRAHHAIVRLRHTEEPTNRRGAPDTRVTLEGVGELGEQRTPFDRSSDGDLDLALPNEDAAHLLERSASIGQQL